MTKSTSQKIAVLKKIAIVPIIVGLIYFFCIEVVAQEKIIGTYSKNNNSEVTDKDKIRDSYYSGVYVNIIDERTNRKDVTLYENLSLEDKRKYLNLIPEIQIEKEIPALLFENLKSKNFKIGINNKLIKKEELKKYQRTDFSYYSCHMINKSERTKEFPQGYQYTLYTKEYFDKNMKNSQVHFKGDTIIIGNVSYQTAMKNKIVKTLKADTLVWYSEGKEGYNLYMNEKKEKKVIVIDAGHGGHDFGATIDDLNEKNLTSEIAKKIKEMHSDSNVEIHFTRTDDQFIALNERTNLINNIKPDLVISLHINNNKNTNSSGFEVYISDKTDFLDKNKEFAEKLSSKLYKTQLKNRGLKTAPFWILKNSICPSMVVELGFISNENDRKFITSEKGQIEIAKHIVAFISEVK